MTTTDTSEAPRTLTTLSLEEKASLTSGASFWTTQPIEHAQVVSVRMADGPHGLRKQGETEDHLGIGGSDPATCFPPAVGLGSSWDAELVYRVGAALGVESSIQDVNLLLGPGANIKRSPLCGRNFEYFSEDPIVSGVLGAAMVAGIQSQGVGASVKHFAANNQEHDRMRVSADVDPRPLREIYLRSFQRIIEEAKPWTVMCSYNRINGVYASEDPWLLTGVLRDEWGFEGVVVSDWGAVNDRVAALVAGLDLEMPSSRGRTNAQIVDAVREGVLDESDLDRTATRLVELAEKAARGASAVTGPMDVDAHHGLAREAAGRSIVLLRNERNLLPLSPETHIAVIGEFAEKPRFQGAGSSLINPTRVDSALDAIQAVSTGDVVFAQGFSTQLDVTAEEEARLTAEAVAAANDADVAVVFLGLPARLESEGYDRVDIDLPASQLAMLEAVLAANADTVVVLSNGGVVALPFADRVPAILEAWLLGQAGGSAMADVIFGEVNPSGKLTETVPVRLADSPAYLDFPGEFSHVRYSEGLFVGYRWYDARDIEVAFPFGHGLSYTTFAYGQASATVDGAGDVKITVDITNTGDRAGREVVQVYTSLPASQIQRAPRELKAFASVNLEVGETKTVVLTMRRKDLAYWDARTDGWVVEGGSYVVGIGASSREIRVSVDVEVQGDHTDLPLTPMSSVSEVLAHSIAGPYVRAALDQVMQQVHGENSLMPEGVSVDLLTMSFPIARVPMLAGDSVTPDMIDRLLAIANAGRQ